MYRSFLLTLFLFLLGCSMQKENYDVYIMAGQSNMSGLGSVTHLPNNIEAKISQVEIFHGSSVADSAAPLGIGCWQTLRPGHGFGFSSDGLKNSYAQTFGPEIGFAQRILEINPGRKILLIKYSRVATSLDAKASMDIGYWLPESDGKTNQFNHLIATIKRALETFKKQKQSHNLNFNLKALLWMQGESDAAFTKSIAERYHSNLSQFIMRFRKELKRPHFPIIMGRISDSYMHNKPVWPYLSVVQRAQEQLAKSDSFISIIKETEQYSYVDKAHYDAASLLRLGKRFAEKAVILHSD